jgi:hypothetical protein
MALIYNRCLQKNNQATTEFNGVKHGVSQSKNLFELNINSVKLCEVPCSPVVKTARFETFATKTLMQNKNYFT